MHQTKRIVTLAFFIAVASILHIVESWIPLPIPVPGAKIGLANIVSLIVIVSYGWRSAIYVTTIRVLLGSLFGGAFLGPTFAMSFSGAFCSTMIMAWFYGRAYPKFSLIGISVLGAIVHNLMQLFIAAIIVTSFSLLWYIPYLVLFALPTGIITGFIGSYFLHKLPVTVFPNK